MQGVHGIGKRKRAVIVSRSAQGEYSTVPSAPRPDDEHDELDPEPVPVHRHRAAGQRRQRLAGGVAHGRAPGHPLSRAPHRVTARDLWVAVETIHAVTYFAPGARAR